MGRDERGWEHVWHEEGSENIVPMGAHCHLGAGHPEELCALCPQ